MLAHFLIIATITATSAATSAADLEAATGNTIPPDAVSCAVRQITDGDTIRVDCGGGPFTLRLWCIDAPELAQEPWGERSRANLARITPPTVRVLEESQDRYGRTVARIYDPTTLTELGARQVRDGAAAVYTKYCTDDRYTIEEGTARAEQIGIWSAEGCHQTPWIFRRHTGDR